MSDSNLTVVIASAAGGEFLFRCLDSLAEQAQHHSVPLLVVDRCGEETRTRIRAEYPRVLVLPAEPGVPATVPALRRQGLEAARAPVVAIIEEHCTVPPDWLETILREFGSADAAIGGPILDSDFTRIRDWVVYFSEYHGFLPPWDAGERLGLNGANIAYARSKVLEFRDQLDRGYWEVVLHPLLAGAGRFRAVPGMGVFHTGPFDYGYYLRQRYLLSRVWGGTRRSMVGWKIAAAHVIAAPLVPLLMLRRIASAAGRAPRLRSRFIAALPLLTVAMVVLAWGEMLGYLLGPGRALEEVE